MDGLVSDKKKMDHYVTIDRFPLEDTCTTHVLVVNFVHFDDNKEPTRHGAEQDDKFLKSVFETYLNCKEVKIVNKTTKSELLNPTNGHITEFIRKCEDNCNLCVFAMMTHGGENGQITLSDGNVINKSSIFDFFSSKNCPKLKLVPKLFLFSVCRGTGEVQYKKALINHLSNSPQSSDSKNPKNCNKVSKNFSLDISLSTDSIKDGDNPVLPLEPEMTEYCIVHSTDEGYPSVRHKNGTLFIRTFCKVLTKFYEVDDFSAIMTRVSKHMCSVTPNVNLSRTKCHKRMVQFCIRCKIDPNFTKQLYFVQKPKKLLKEDEVEWNDNIRSFMITNFPTEEPVVIKQGLDENMEIDFSDQKELKNINEISREMENFSLDNANPVSGLSNDECIFGRLLSKREIFSTESEEEYPTRFSFVFRDVSGELTIYSYGTSGAKLFIKLEEQKCYLIHDAIVKVAQPLTSPLGSSTIQIVMNPECVREVQLDGIRTIDHIPNYMSYEFSPLNIVEQITTQKDVFYDVIGRLQHHEKKSQVLKNNCGDTILLIGPNNTTIEVVVWNEYRDFIPSYGDVVAIRHGKLYKGIVPRRLSVNTNSFIAKIEKEDQLPPSQLKFFTDLPEKNTSKRRRLCNTP